MDFPTAYGIIKAKIETDWAVAFPSVPVIFTNEQRPTFDEAPNCLHVEIRGGAPRTVGWGGGQGKNRQRQSGEVIFRHFVPADTEMETVLARAESGCVILRFWQPGGGLRFFEAAPTGGSEDEKVGLFYEQDALANFFYDTIG